MLDWQAKKKFDETLSSEEVQGGVRSSPQSDYKELKWSTTSVGYMASYCGLMPSTCKHNMRMAMAKRKMRKEGLPIDGLPIDGCQLMEVRWGSKPRPMKTRR